MEYNTNNLCKNIPVAIIMINDKYDRFAALQYKVSSLKELLRKGIHISSSITAISLIYFDKLITAAALITLGIVYTICELFRQKGYEVPLITKVTSAASRARDEGHFVLGPLALVVGLLLTVIIFDNTISICGIFALAFGDGVASLVGRLFGRIPIPFTFGKTVEGSLACFFAIFTTIFFYCHSCNNAFVMAITAMAIEALPLGDFDNIAIPISTAIVATILTR